MKMMQNYYVDFTLSMQNRCYW